MDSRKCFSPNFAVPDAHNSFPNSEEEILSYWKEINAFETSLEQSKGKKLYTFYDGPPFATGLPHYGHILAGTIKDIVTRYAHQTGHHVPRRFGWDTHGLPIEFEIDKKAGQSSQELVDQKGLPYYIKECRSIVDKYVTEWERVVNRVGRWIDFKNAYRTMDTTFMESVWWIFSELYKKGLIYRSFRVMPYSTGCTTTLSNFEANLNYKDVTDQTAVVSFPIRDDPDNAAFLAWTTTPWTLPSNLALIVHPTFTYVKIRDLVKNAVYIVAKPRIVEIFPLKGGAKEIPAKTDKYEILSEFPGSSLVGTKYVPLFDYFYEKCKDTAFRVIADEYVTDDSGTGIVHAAPGFGEDDYRVCATNGIFTKDSYFVCPVDESGCLTSEVGELSGLYIKDADKVVLKILRNAGRVIQDKNYQHSYPFCWRSETPLIYKAVPSWFVAVETIKERLVANNELTYWVPSSIGEGRFANWLKDARDWNISRTRYWGTPVPLWMSKDGTQIKVVGSIAELEKETGATNITDIHRPSVDDLVIEDPRGPEYPPLERVDCVFDCWFESGSMPFAQIHYPFENQDLFDNGFPADFIAEGLDQTRGWFYTLMVLSTAITDKPAFKNLIVNGLILAEDGKKMSKSKNNYPDPNGIINNYGADALRLYLINSPVVRAEPLIFNRDGPGNVVRRVLLPWWNAYRFCIENIVRFNEQSSTTFSMNPKILTTVTNVMDKWIIASLQSLIDDVKVEMGAYRLYTVVPILLRFIDQLCNWYVRTNRRRLKGLGNDDTDRLQALSTLTYVLYELCRLMAPLTPFITEVMYHQLKYALPEDERVDSVHYLMVPDSNSSVKNPEVERAIDALQTVVELGRVGRDNSQVAIKTPLSSITIVSANASTLEDLRGLEDYIRDELNVRTIVYESNAASFIRPVVTPIPAKLAPKLGKNYRAITQLLAELPADQIEQGQSTGKIVINDVEISSEDLEFSIVSASADPSLQVSFANGIVCALDVSIDKSSLLEGVAREVVSYVQKIRKLEKFPLFTKFDVYLNSFETINSSLSSKNPLVGIYASKNDTDSSKNAYWNQSANTIYVDNETSLTDNELRDVSYFSALAKSQIEGEKKPATEEAKAKGKGKAKGKAETKQPATAANTEKITIADLKEFFAKDDTFMKSLDFNIIVDTQAPVQNILAYARVDVSEFDLGIALSGK